jgi:hypothetical protein
MNDAKDHKLFTAIRERDQTIRDDIGQSWDNLLVCTRYSAGPSGRHFPKRVPGPLYAVRHPSGSGGIAGSYVEGQTFKVAKRRPRPFNGSHALAFFLAARAIAARTLRMALSCEIVRPASMSSSPCLIPSTISNSRSTKSAIARPARNDRVRLVRRAKRPSRSFVFAEIRTVNVVVAGMSAPIVCTCTHRRTMPHNASPCKQCDDWSAWARPLRGLSPPYDSLITARRRRCCRRRRW